MRISSLDRFLSIGVQFRSSSNDTKTEDFEKFKAAAEAAEAAGRGVHESDPDLRAMSRFEFDTSAAADGADYVLLKGQGCPVPGFVDAVLTGYVGLSCCFGRCSGCMPGFCLRRVYGHRALLF